MFFMTFEDFSKHFEVFSICYYYDNWHHTHQKVTLGTNHAAYYEFEIADDIQAVFRVHQPDERSMKDTNPDYKYSETEIDGTLVDLVPLKEKDEYSFNRNYAVNSRNEYRGMNLEPGKYLIRAKANWLSGKEETFTISAYSSKSLTLMNPEVPHKNTHYKAMAKGLASKKTKIPIQNGVWYVDGWSDYEVYYYVVFNDGKETIEMEWILKNHEFFRFKKCNRGDMIADNKVKLKLSAGLSDAIIIKEKDSSKQVGPSFEWKIQYKN